MGAIFETSATFIKYRRICKMSFNWSLGVPFCTDRSRQCRDDRGDAHLTRIPLWMRVNTAPDRPNSKHGRLRRILWRRPTLSRPRPHMRRGPNLAGLGRRTELCCVTRPAVGGGGGPAPYMVVCDAAPALLNVSRALVGREGRASKAKSSRAEAAASETSKRFLFVNVAADEGRRNGQTTG